MSDKLSRRTFLATAFGAATGGALLPRLSSGTAATFLSQIASPRAAAALPTTIQATKRTLEVNGKAASVMGLLQPNGTQGMNTAVNEPFLVTMENKLPVPTAIHWHGLHPPNNEDGVPGVTQLAIRPNASSLYNFPVQPAGTHWMHSHQGLQEAFLLAAPLIVHDPADHLRDEQEIVLFLSDFSFTPPKEVFATLRSQSKGMSAAGGLGKSNMSAVTPVTAMKPSQDMTMAADKPDANDVNYDAYLANDRTLSDPEVVKIEKGGQVRLRIINGSSGTNFFIDLGYLSGELIATDGMPVRPIQNKRFPLAIAQRIDLRVRVPREGGAFPIIALREFATEQTGIVLATPGTRIQKYPVNNALPTDLLTLGQERELVAVNPLKARSADQVYELRLQGNMRSYEWMINGHAFDVANPSSEQAPLRVKAGQRVAFKFINETPMSHPMHLHGHSFQVVAIDDRRITGALRDTILVPGRTSVTVEFDANNPGLWYVHCHVLWHLAAGMATLVQYDA